MNPPIRLLLVEDDAADVALLAMWLKERNFDATIHCVDSLADLDRELQRGEWDIVISDHKLPGLTSAHVMGLVRARQPDLPLVIVSGQIGEDLAVECLKAGADDYVMKDRLARLVPALQRAMVDRRLRRAEREATEALRVTQAHLQWLVKSSPVVVYEADMSPRRELRFVSENVSALTGREACTLVGRPESEWRDVHPEDASIFHEALSRLTASGTPQRYVYRCRHADGTYRWVQDDIRLAASPDGQMTTLVGALMDVTEQRALQEHASQAQRLDAVGRVASGVAHDFNNLLAAILGSSAELLADLEPEDPHYAVAETIQRAARRGAGVVSRLLALSRRQALRPRLHDLNELVRTVEPLLRSVFSRGATLNVVYGPMPQLVMVDDAQFEQVVLNLVVNARDATPLSGVVTLLVGADPDGYATLTVSDTGDGISADVLPRIFEPFFTTKAPGAGTGLGLPMVLDVVKQSGGAIDVKSVVGQGTRVTVRLPAIAETRRDGEESPPPDLSARASVLLVDDDDLVRDVVNRALSAAGHTVHAAASGQEALRLHGQNGAVDVLVTDLTMPGLGGVDLAKLMITRQPSLKVLCISGCYEGSELLSNVSTAFLAKPFEADDLLAAVAQLIAVDGREQSV